MPSSDSDLIYGGECPVCGREFIDGFRDLDQGDTYEVDLCVVATPESEEDAGKALIHLTGENA
jgi:hypothetical protein